MDENISIKDITRWHQKQDLLAHWVYLISRGNFKIKVVGHVKLTWTLTVENLLGIKVKDKMFQLFFNLKRFSFISEKRIKLEKFCSGPIFRFREFAPNSIFINTA